jgi:branched-subunit amino acid transport protein AzlD
MTAWLAVLCIGVGSIALRAVPLLTTRRLPERVTAAAGAGGISVLVGFAVRSVLEYVDPATRYAVPVAVAVVAVGVGLVAAFRGRGVLTSTAVGLLVYVAVVGMIGAVR